mgnify:CR=1 FL=1
MNGGWRRNGAAGAALLAGLALAAGCSTPASRIKREAALFATFPPEVQENVRQGRVAVGYTPEMVRLALGAPSRVYERETAAGRAEIWAYTDVRFASDLEPVTTRYWYRDARGRLRLAHDWGWADVTRTQEYENLRIEFRDGRVFAIERRSR